MNKKRKSIFENLILPFLSIAILIFMWYIFSLIYDNPFLLPRPIQVIKEIFNLLKAQVFWSSFCASLFRCILALLLSLLLSLVLATLSVLFRRIHKMLAPIVIVLRSVPTMSIIFILIFVFSPKTAPIFVVFLVVMPSMYSMHISAFLAVPKELIETGRVFGFNKFEQVTKVYLPLSMPVLLESVAGGFSLSFKILVASEVLSSTANSIGYMLTLANLNIQIAKLIALTLMAIMVCLIFEFFMRTLIERTSKHLY